MSVSVTAKGVRASSLAETLVEQEQRLKDRFGEDLSQSPHTPQAQIAGVEASAITEVNEAIVQDANAASIDHAGGVHLDALGSNLDVRRREATYSRVTATLTGVSGTGVPVNSRARTDPGGDEFRTLVAVILSPNGGAGRYGSG